MSALSLWGMSSRDHFVYVLSQWEATLHCSVISHSHGGTLMTSAAAKVINHNRRKIIWFKTYTILLGKDVILANIQRFISCYLQDISTYLSSSKSVKNYIYAKIQAEICMFTQQNPWGLNRQILRPLWLMTSAAADVISVPGVSLAEHIHKIILGQGIILKHWYLNKMVHNLSKTFPNAFSW